MKNKKSLMIISALVRIVIALAILFIIVIPACNYIRKVFFSQGSESFETFVDGINVIALGGKEEFALRLNEKSAVIGFGNSTNRYECFNCYVGTAKPRPTIVVNRPDSPECADGACVCLCDKNFKLEGENPKIGQCNDPLCKKINSDITSKTIIKKYTSGTEHWNNGFLFVNGVIDANGLKFYNEEVTLLYVEKKGNLIGVCNKDMLDFNKNRLGLPEGTCINKDSG